MGNSVVNTAINSKDRPGKHPAPRRNDAFQNMTKNGCPQVKGGGRFSLL